MINDKFCNTIMVLIDDLPDYERGSVEELCILLEDNNKYDLLRLTVEEFKDLNNPCDTVGFLLIIPNSESVPLDVTDDLKDYALRGGQILTLGGPLFYNLVEKNNENNYEKIKLDDLLDATFTRQGSFVIEGITPSYKTYSAKNIQYFKTENNQMCFDGEISTDVPLDFICPCEYGHGIGYNNEPNNRFIPLVSAMGSSNDDFIKEGMAGGRRGAAAFIVLSNTKYGGYRGKTRAGIVENTTIGSAAASIGIRKQDILTVKGMDKLLLSIISMMQRGLYLFEGGVEGYRFKRGEEMIFGARVLNVSQFFKSVELRFSISDHGKTIFEKSRKLLAAPRHITDLSFSLSSSELSEMDLPRDENLTVVSEMIFNNEVIDIIEQEVSFLRDKRPDQNEFVTVKDGDFYLKGEVWYPAGINYWPSYYPAMEIDNYWCGFFDKTNYDPLIIERDLEYLEKMGINCLFTRLDGYNHDRVKNSLADFLLRCENHNMKVSLSYPNATSPAYYSSEAFQRLINESELAGNTAIFCHDIAWESGGDFLQPWNREYLDQDWENWIVERYGSIENAETDWGASIFRNADGKITSPGDDQLLKNDEKYRIMVAAYRRFLDDYVSGLWNRAIRDMKKYDSNHLYTYRFGMSSHRTVAFSATNKHIDFMCPEGYSITNDEQGYYTACFITSYIDFMSRGKPVVWAEYGRSLCGVKWSGELIWNHEEFSYQQEEVDKQTEYNSLFYKMIINTGAKGSAPWWWCGGFRLSELADFGYMGPDGLLRPCGVEYIDFIKELKTSEKNKQADTYINVDRDLYTCGDNYICETIGSKAWKEADEKGLYPAVKTEATGTNSANTPLVAVGNTRYNGKNPPKYLNSEFNSIFIYQDKDKKINIKKNAVVKVRKNKPIYIDINAGNLQEAEWLAPVDSEDKGGVYFISARGSELKFKFAIEEDTAYLNDAEIKGAKLSDGINSAKEVSICMEAEKRMYFGEVFNFTLSVYQNKSEGSR